jgi:hypothetical protein
MELPKFFWLGFNQEIIMPDILGKIAPPKNNQHQEHTTITLVDFIKGIGVLTKQVKIIKNKLYLGTIGPSYPPKD